MNRVLLLLGLALLAMLSDHPKNAAAEKTSAIAHVTVIDATGAPPKADQTVLIEGERISGIGASGSIRVPQRAQIIDATGLYLIPGLWDMHVHIWDASLAFPLFLRHQSRQGQNM